MVGLLLVKVVSVVGSATVPVISYIGLKYLNKRWNLSLTQGEEKYLLSLGHKGAMYGDQLYKNMDKGEQTNKLKLETAKNYVLQNAARKGIKIDDKMAENNVEIALHELNMKRDSG